MNQPSASSTPPPLRATLEQLLERDWLEASLADALARGMACARNHDYSTAAAELDVARTRLRQLAELSLTTTNETEK